jgi:hypothetical protein
MDDLLLANDSRLLLTLLGCAFVLVLAWTMDGIAQGERAKHADPGAAPAPRLPDPPAPQRFDAPEGCAGPIGRYMGATIFETISIGGREYRFDRVLAPGARWLAERGERCIAPGLVYVGR